MNQSAPSLERSALDRIDNLLTQIEQLTYPETEPPVFHAEGLNGLVELLNATGGAVWLVRGTECSVLHATGHAGTCPASSENIATVCAGAAPERRSGPQGAACVFAGRDIDPRHRLLLEVRFSADASIPAGIDDILVVFSGIFAEYHRARLLGVLGQQIELANRTAELASALHQTLRSDHIATIFANDAAPICGVDRISVLQVRAAHVQLLAATGVTNVNERSDAARALEQFVRRVRSVGNPPGWCDAQTAADDVREAVSDFLTQTGACSVRWEILGPDPQSWEACCGAIIFEKFTAAVPDASVQSGSDPIPETMTHASQAFANAAAYEQRSLSGYITTFRETIRSRRSLWTVGIVATLLLMLCVFPADFEIKALGQVQPIQRRRVFAPDDGVITSLLVTNEATVEAGDPLLQLHNPDMDLEEKRIVGEISTATARLAATEAARVDYANRNLRDVSQGQLTAEAEELRQRIASLESQRAIVERRINSLTVCAPIDGEVFRRHLVVDLEGRPVQRGQLLLSVNQPKGAWQLELRVPDRSVRHVLAAAQDSDEPLTVRFLFRTSPSQTWQESLGSISQATDLDETGNLSSLAIVPLKQTDRDLLRPGSSVIASIGCGSKPLGYVLFREVIEFVQTYILF
jgi:multidrug efflux pump subunit AcrA (membrane-fusion protein)